MIQTDTTSTEPAASEPGAPSSTAGQGEGQSAAPTVPSRIAVERAAGAKHVAARGVALPMQHAGTYSAQVASWGLMLAGLSLFLAVILRWIVLRVMDGYLKQLVDKTQTSFDNKVHGALRRSVGYFILLGGCFLALSFIELPTQPVDWRAMLSHTLSTLFIVSGGLLAYRIAEITLSYLSEKHGTAKKSLLDQQLLPLLHDVTKVGLTLLVAVGVAQSWGYSPAGILAGVGIGGLALAFAAQDAVANVFGSFIVFSDRPYKIGDWIQLSGIEGTVEEIGIRSTRIRTFDKALVSVPNKIVTNESIYNYSEMNVRRIELTLRLAYDTQPEQILAVVKDLREILKGHPGIDQEYWVVSFCELSTYSLDVLVYCFTRSTVWEEFLDVKQDLLLRIMSTCRRYGAHLAYPSSTVYSAAPSADGPLAKAEPGLPLPDKFVPNPDSAPQTSDKDYGMEFNRAEEK